MRRAIGPFTPSRPDPGAATPPLGTNPWVGLSPDSPQSADGMRIDPPPSDPVASGTMPAAMAAAVPPDDPPGERSVFHGLRVAPNGALLVSAFQPCSGVFVLPSTTQPAARKRATCVESSAAGASSTCSAEPNVVVNPAAASRSFTPIGMPASGPTVSPAASRSSMRAADASAASGSRATKQLVVASSASMRSSACWVTSRAEMSRARTRAASPATVSLRKSTEGTLVGPDPSLLDEAE